MKTPTNLSSSSTRREYFSASTSISGCGFSAPEEMQGQHHDTDYQQHVNQGTGNVKREETKQPKNNQNCRNCSQHFLTPFLAKRAIRICMPRKARIAPLRWIRAYVDKPARLGILNLFDMSHIFKITASPLIFANPNLQTACLSGQFCFSSDATMPHRLVV
jgi:hypothetical protein